MISISQPLIAKNAKKYLLDCLTSGWVSSAGAYIEKFEEAFAAYIGTTYAVATSSGTSAIHLSLAALDIGPGDEVIIPAYTMVATLLPILYVGATPILVDSEDVTGNIDISLIEQKITKKTKAIIPVHMFGHPTDMDPVLKLAKMYHLFVIEDAAEAHGALYKGKKVGSIGSTGCFSFYGNKIITTGEGGMVTTNNKAFADSLKSLRNLARTPGKHFLHQELGFAYRMSNLQAALGLAELEDIDTYITRKKNIATRYSTLLGDIAEITLPIQKPYAESVFWQYGILLKNKELLPPLETYLTRRGIETRRYFIPMHKQPFCQKKELFTHQTYPVAEHLQQHGLCIPSGVAMMEKEIAFVAQTILDYLA